MTYFKKFLQPLFISSVFLFLFYGVDALSQELPERRRDQIPSEFGYLVSPIPYSLPGVGTGLGALAALNNIKETPVDLFAVLIRGDVEGSIFGVTDLPLFQRHLLFDVAYSDFNRGTQQFSTKRGMGSLRKNDVNLLEYSEARLFGGRAILNFFNRRLEFYHINYTTSFRIRSIRNSDGDLISKTNDASKQSFNLVNWGMAVDLTDDRLDPRQGVRMTVERPQPGRASAETADQYPLDVNLTGFIPVLRNSTLVFNYFQSDVQMIRKGLVDQDEIRRRSNFSCEANENQELCEKSVGDFAKNTSNNNRYGNATSLGGYKKLRSYPEGRFSGAHASFYGTEFRWNLTDENTPFDLFFIKDVRTGIQLAAFYERGSVVDRIQDRWSVSRESTGVGARLITSSGFIYRADYSVGQEGGNFILFFDYPWGTL